MWAVDTSDLELQNAVTKRKAESGGSKCLELRAEGQMRAPLHSEEDRQKRMALEKTAGPGKMISTSGYSTTLALSTMRSLLALGKLRRGDGILSIPRLHGKQRGSLRMVG